MVGALRVMADAYNPYTSVEKFVWALQPFPAKDPPETFLEAVESPPHGDQEAPADEEGTVALDRYLTSIGLVATESNRRAAARRKAQGPLPPWKNAVLGRIARSPRIDAAFKKAYGRVR